MHSMQNNRQKRLLVITAATLIVSSPFSTAWARHRVPGGPEPRPFGHDVIHVGPFAYFFMGGLFYRFGPNGYVIVPAPAGAVIETLPPGAILVTVDGRQYYTSAGVYYRRIDSGYVVVEEPVQQAVPEVGVGWKLEVNVDLLNVRSGPGLQHGVLQQIRQGTVVEVDAVRDGWCLVRLGDNTTGWIESRYAVVVGSGAKG